MSSYFYKKTLEHILEYIRTQDDDYSIKEDRLVNFQFWVCERISYKDTTGASEKGSDVMKDKARTYQIKKRKKI